MAMIKTQLRARKLESEVSGVTVRHASITEKVTAMALRSEPRIARPPCWAVRGRTTRRPPPGRATRCRSGRSHALLGRRVDLFEGGPRVGPPHAAWYIDDAPLIITQD